MGIMGLVKLVLIGLAIWMLYRGIKSVMAGGAQRRRPVERGDGGGEVLDVMVQCAECGTYLPRKEALLSRAKGQERYFCSPGCRQVFVTKSERPQNGDDKA